MNDRARPHILVALLVAPWGCGSSSAPLGLHADYDPPDKEDCDPAYAYRWWTIAWDDQPEGAWETPAEALGRIGTEHTWEILWEADDVADAPWVGTLDRWHGSLARHAARPPVWAPSSEPEICPDLLVLPLAVTLWSDEGSVWLDDPGERWSDDWEDDLWTFPWESGVASLIVTAQRHEFELASNPERPELEAWTDEIDDWMVADAATKQCVDPHLQAGFWGNDEIWESGLGYVCDPTFGEEGAIIRSMIARGSGWSHEVGEAP